MLLCMQVVKIVFMSFMYCCTFIFLRKTHVVLKLHMNKCIKYFVINDLHRVWQVNRKNRSFLRKIYTKMYFLLKMDMHNKISYIVQYYPCYKIKYYAYTAIIYSKQRQTSTQNASAKRSIIKSIFYYEKYRQLKKSCPKNTKILKIPKIRYVSSTDREYILSPTKMHFYIF